MIENFFQAFINLIFRVLGTVSGFTIDPVMRWFQTYVPGMTPFLTVTTTFLSRVLNGVAFAKEVILNVTGLDRGLFTTLIGLFFAKIAYNSLARLCRFVFNMYFYIRGAHGVSKGLANM